MRAASCVFPHFWHFGDTAKLSCGVTASKCKSIIFEWNSLLISLFNKHRWGWIAKSVISWVYDTQMRFRAFPTNLWEGCKVSANNTWVQLLWPPCDPPGRGVTNGFGEVVDLVLDFCRFKIGQKLDFTIWEYNFRDILWNFDESVLIWFGKSLKMAISSRLFDFLDWQISGEINFFLFLLP